MKIYLVGGAVRDKLLGLPIKERDWVVVGATIADMEKSGFRQVGKEFPVFLHPKTNEEYALARLERKVEPGYQGFTFDTSPDVTLEEDLARRDLTINAMAETDDGTLIDPYHGKQDLEARCLRHVSPAFSEDPVRVLRIGRFLARFSHLGFHIAPETLTLMQAMVKAGEVNALVAERVWKELERSLGERNPEKFFEVLDQCNALATLFPQLEMNGIGMRALVNAVKLTPNTAVRFAALLHSMPEAKNSIAIICDLYRVPNTYRELATLVSTHYSKALEAKKLNASELLELYSKLDIFRREERFRDFICACEAIASANKIAFTPTWLLEGAKTAKNVDVQALISQGLTGSELAEKLKEKRREEIATWLNKTS
jgi:tRNA nucleotidyltransferase (CCA-adding enzyme)